MLLKPTVLIAACLMAFGQAGSSGVSSAQSATLSIVINMPRTSISSNGPISLDVSMTNGSDQILFVPSTRLKLASLSGITIREEAGGKLLKSRLEAQENVARVIGPEIQPIGPGKTVSEFVNLRNSFDLGPGRYSICVKKKDPVTGQQVTSNTVTFTVR